MDNSVKRTKEKNIEIIADALMHIANKLSTLALCSNIQTEMLMERFRIDIGDDKLDGIFRLVTHYTYPEKEKDK